MIALVEKPRQRDRSRRGPCFLRHRLDLAHDSQVLLEVAVDKPRVFAAEVVSAELRQRADLAGEESAPEGQNLCPTYWRGTPRSEPLLSFWVSTGPITGGSSNGGTVHLHRDEQTHGGKARG